MTYLMVSATQPLLFAREVSVAIIALAVFSYSLSFKRRGSITMRKTLLATLGIILILMLAACGGNKVEDSTAEIYITKAEGIIDLLNEGNYEAVHAMFGDAMKTGLPVEDMGELTPIIEESGSFEEIDKASVEEDDGLYITVLVAKYSDKKRVFTITFNDKEEVAGLFIK